MTTTDNVTDVGNLHDSEPDAQAGHPRPASTDDDKPSASEIDDRDDDQDAGDGATDIEKARREAARYRTRLREVEAERDQLAAQLATNHEDIVSQIAADAGMPDRSLLNAAGYEVGDMLTEDGRVDREKATAACRETMKRYRIARPPSPNMQQSTGTRMPGQSASEAFAAAFAPPKA